MKHKLYTTAGLVLVILLVLNLLSNEFHVRFDITDEKQYTLSQATIDILENLENPITVKAYFSKNLPPGIIKARQDFQEMLIEYASLADGMLLYEFNNPNENEKNEQEAIGQGIQAVLINVREKDQVRQQKAFLGATVSSGEKVEVIPFMQPGSAIEYTLSTTIKKIAIKERESVAFVQGHGEPPLSELGQLQKELSVLYNIEEIALDTMSILPSVKTLIIVRPSDSIPVATLDKIDRFLLKGGRLAIAMNRVAGNLQTAKGTTINTGLATWLQKKGLVVENNFVVDASCGSVTVQQQQGFFTMQTNVPFPYIPIIKNFADHPITKGLENVMFEFVSTIRYTGDTTKRFTPIAFSSDKSTMLPAPVSFDVQKQWADSDFTLKNLPVAACMEEKIGEGNFAKMVVIADGDFAVNGPPQQPRMLQPDNVNLLSNAIDWLSDDTGLIELRTKSVTSYPIDELKETTRTILKYVNFLSPIVFVAIYGLVRIQRNRMKRLKRASENYEEI